MNLLLIFDMHDINGALFLKTNFIFLSLALTVPETIFSYFTIIYASL